MNKVAVHPTLWNVFFDDDVLPEAAAATLEAQTGMAGVREKLSETMVAGFAAGVRTSLAECLQRLLGTPLEEIIGGAWCTYHDLLRYCDASEHPPEEIALVPLRTHTVSSTHKPYVEVLINNQPRGRITFDVTMALKIDTATLKIQGGRIWEIRTGSCTGEGTITCGPAVLAECRTRTIALPGTIVFSAGVPIAPAK